MNLHLRLVLAQNWCICGNRFPSCEMKNYSPYLPQCEVQVRGVVSGWHDINHWVAAQRRIRAIHAQPYPIMRIPF